MLVKNVLSLPMIPAGHSSGDEPVRFAEAFGGQDFVGKWGCVEYVTVPTGSAIPVHRHDQDEELYFILEGEGILTIDGIKHQVGLGDLAICRRDSSHGLENSTDREIKLIVVGIPV